MLKVLKDAFSSAKTHYGIGISQTLNKFTTSLNKLFVDYNYFNEEFFENLEEKLIELDITPNLAILIVEKLEVKVYNQRVDKKTFKTAMVEVINEVIQFKEDNEIEIKEDKLNVFLIVGINGVGKTTTISKLSNIYREKNLELIAADTFRAGAIEQLSIWAQRLNIPITKTHQGHAPSAVVYEGMQSAINNKRELVICDTAGRLHNKTDLMNELKKIREVINKHENINLKTLLVLDGTAGKNAITQAQVFKEVTEVDGIIVTKLDSNGKAGIIVNVAYELNVPIYYITTGEQIQDIKRFDYQEYINALFEVQ